MGVPKIKKVDHEDVQIDLVEAARLTGYSKEHIRNLVYAGQLHRMSEQSQKLNDDGSLKRGPKIRVSKQEVIAKLGPKSA